MLHAFLTPDPIHAVIERHRAAYDAYQIAPEGVASMEANDEYDAASEALVSTACATRFGALAFLAHLRWWLIEEADFRDGYQPAYSLAEARAADLTLFLGTPLLPAVIPQSIPPAAPSGRLGMPQTSRFLRSVRAVGELLAAVAIIGGGMVLTGLASLL